METREAPVMADDTRALKPARFVDEISRRISGHLLHFNTT